MGSSTSVEELWATMSLAGSSTTVRSMIPTHNSESQKYTVHSKKLTLVLVALLHECILCYTAILHFNRSFSCLLTCLCLPLSVLRWKELCGMRVARKNHGLVVVNNRIYAIGGQGALGNNTNITTTTTVIMSNAVLLIPEATVVIILCVSTET